MKPALLLLLCVLVVAGHCAAKPDGSNVRQRRREQQFPPANITTIVSNATQPRIIGLRWINADTNEPIAITTITGTSVWILTEAVTGFPPLVPDYQIAALAGTGLSIEAVTEGPVESVVFERFDSPGPDVKIRNVENTARWAMCGNIGKEFFSCASFWDTLRPLKVTAYTRKWGAGPVAQEVQAFINSVPTTPKLEFYLDTPTKPWNSADRIKLSEGNATNVISLAQTSPNITFVMQYQINRFEWDPERVDFSYDDGAIVTTFTSDSFSLSGIFSFLGSEGSGFKYFTPTLGRHTLTTTLYRTPDSVGAVRTVTIDVTN